MPMLDHGRNEHFLIFPVALNRTGPRDGLPKEIADVIMKIQ